MTGRRTIKARIAFLVSFLGTLVSVSQTHAQVGRPLVKAEMARVADTAHLEFRGLRNWRYELQRDGDKKMVLSVPPMDDASIAKLQSFSDNLIDSVKVEKKGPDGNFQIIFNLAQAQVESFDYLTDDPSRLIIDFYRKNEAAQPKPAAIAATTPAAKAEKKAIKPTAPAKPQTSKLNEQDYASVPKADRSPAGDEILASGATSTKEQPTDVITRFGIFDGGDDNYDRFRIKDYEIQEDAMISSRHNIYLPFPMLKMNVSQLDLLMDRGVEYSIKPKDTRENKEARLLLTLFERKRFGVFLRTYDYFMRQYPESEYSEILKNLSAHVHLTKWRQTANSAEFDKARAIYSELVQKLPNSPLREHNYLILGFAQMERGDALSTLQTFQGFLKTYPSAPEIPQVRKALAEAYMILRKYDEATAEYETIIKDFPKTDHAKEATYRLGDAKFARGDYSQAIEAYEAAIKQLPDQEKVYPNANYNMAEARFWQKDFKKALVNYVQFVNLFPTHQHGGYALTRIGELLGILGADPRRVMGAFLESYFRFPNHPGSKVARIRMLSQQMRGMKVKELKKSLEEIDEAAEKLNLPGIVEFTRLMAAEGLTNRGEYREALEKLITYYQKTPMSVNLDSFKSRILRNISNELKDKIERNEFMQALTFYSGYSTTWLKNVDRIDVPFFVAGAYELAGAYTEAERIYREALAKRISIVGTAEERERKVREHLPSVSSLHLRLAATLAHDRNFVDAYQQLKAVGTDITPNEVVERVQLSALISEQRNDHVRAREALVELAKKWQGDTALVAPVNLQLAQTFMKLGDAKQAEDHANQVLAAEGGETVIPEKTIASALEVKASALFAQKKELAAVEIYQKLLERFETKLPLSNVRYRVGQILFERGDHKGAEDVWKRLEGTPHDLLWKIGKERLEDSQWQDDYRKYTNRIPAMVNKTMDPSGKAKPTANAKESKP